MPLLTSSQIQHTLTLAAKTAEIILHHYQQGIDVNIKKDNSPVTQADVAASERLEAELPRIAPYPVLSEENVPDNHEWLDWETYWIIDPIDGTKHFINQTGEFCICIALIHQNRAVFGLIYAPTTHTAWFAQQPQNIDQQHPENNQVFRYQRQTIQALSPCSPTSLAITLSADKLSQPMENLLNIFPNYQWYRRGSALKYIDIVEGKASIYPKMWDTCEWDSAAGQCILECLGGQVIDFNTGLPLRYGNKASLLNSHFLAYQHLEQCQIEQLLQRYQQIQSS